MHAQANDEFDKLNSQPEHFALLLTNDLAKRQEQEEFQTFRTFEAIAQIKAYPPDVSHRLLHRNVDARPQLP